MTTQKRRQRTAEEKLKIIEEARQTPTTISEVCRRHGVASGQFCTWEQQARQGALEAIRNKTKGRKKKDATAHLETELQQLRAVIAELSVENLTLKKGVDHKAVSPLQRR